jgi:integrase
MRVRHRDLPSGKRVWVVDYVDQTGKRRAPQWATRREAVGESKKITAELEAGVHTPTKDSITIAQAGDIWLAHVERLQREATTLRQYRGHLAAHIVPILGRMKLAKLSTPQVEAFADELAKKLSLPMAKKVLTSLKSLIAITQRRGYVAVNVALPAKIETSGRDQERARIPSKIELQALIAKSADMAPRWRPLIITAIMAGLRASELRGLAWDAVDLDGRVLEVRQRMDAFQKLGPPKSKAGRRAVPLSPMCANTLREWKLRCPPGQLGLVFPTTEGKPMFITDIGRLCWEPLTRACGLEGRYEFHHLRHACASLLIEQGALPKRIQEILGHSSIRVTFDVYGHLFSDAAADQALVAKAEKGLFG